ncbi:MAG: 3-deoxy-D-manno-octulosonic acid transferase [Psychroflexus halocasei]|uniref:3-deoxy-D-manno-octulosonic acid transferase n=1 Tax=Psychroflexus sp. S27 TaxID=1982757 RepID=UPI001865606F|nr:glycosyltransferase N-terminal domain-containing protein [Psychroflexus sp. S27]
MLSFFIKLYFCQNQRQIYTIAVNIFKSLLPLLAKANKSIAKFYQGRKNLFQKLEKDTRHLNNPIWIHAASLGEYEQAVPLIEVFKSKGYEVVVSFFSPSGYDIKKNDNLIDVATYLPLDTKSDMQKFVKIINPKMALFIKYDVWPNLMKILKQKDIPTYLISANFRENQIYFKWYGNFFLKALQSFDIVFVQNKESEKLAQELHLKSIEISGDTRYDRVIKQLTYNNHIDRIDEFINNKLCTVCGSTWPEDEEVLSKVINKSKEQEKFIIAPHKVDANHIKDIEQLLQKKSICWSEIEPETNLNTFQILIIDCIGLLTKLYSYADIAYVGGAIGQTGLHNILEPACFGKPVIFGHHHDKFPEAQELINAKASFDIKNHEDLKTIYQRLKNSDQLRQGIGKNAKAFIEKNAGATDLIMRQIID